MKEVAILGTGPAGLMAAEVVSKAGHQVHLFDKATAPGRKILIAGASGLNVANSSDFPSDFNASDAFWKALLHDFSRQDWIDFIETELKMPTFLGTSGRYFIKTEGSSQTAKAAAFLKTWIDRLESRGVQLHCNQECKGFDLKGAKISLKFFNQKDLDFDAVCFALGGASYVENTDFQNFFTEKNLKFNPFKASNVGYEVKWPEAFLSEAEGQALKNINFTTAKGSKRGELVITKYGLEGTPVYTLGKAGKASIDLFPDLSYEQIIEKCSDVKENLSHIRRIKNKLNLSQAALALLFHCTSNEAQKSLEVLVKQSKNLEVELTKPRPIAEAISSSGGLSLDELNSDLMLKRFPKVFAAGEMLDWDAPTGGFLIQGCVSMGYKAGHSILKMLG